MRLFGGILPFIGFRLYDVDRSFALNVFGVTGKPGKQPNTVLINVFVLEWLNCGFMFPIILRD